MAGGGATIPMRREWFELEVGSTLGALLDALEARTPATCGAWRGYVVTTGNSASTAFMRKHVLTDNAAVHAFDVAPPYMWVITDMAPPIAVSATAAHEEAYGHAATMGDVRPSLMQLAHTALAAICDDELAPPTQVMRGPAVWKPSVGTLIAVFPKAPLLLCGTFGDAAFAVQPEDDAALQDALLRMWLRKQEGRRAAMWAALRNVCAQRVVFDTRHGDNPPLKVPFTARLKVVPDGGGCAIIVQVSIDETFPSYVTRVGAHPGGDRSVGNRVGVFDGASEIHHRHFVEELQSRVMGADGMLKRAVMAYRYRHTFGRDTATVLRVAKQGSIMRRRSEPPPPPWLVSACREAGLFDWQTQQVWSFKALESMSTEWYPVRAHAASGAAVFVHATEPAIRVGAPVVRTAAAMVNPTGSGKTIMAAMLARLPMWNERPEDMDHPTPSHMTADATDAREVQLRAKRDMDTAHSAQRLAAAPTMVANAINVTKCPKHSAKFYRLPPSANDIPPAASDPAAAGPSVQVPKHAGVLYVVPPNVVPQWAAELRRMGVPPVVYYADGKKNFDGELGFDKHRAVVTSISVFSQAQARITPTL